jgi:predicted NUDIX family NTP pyrophosphohydrolase
MPISPTGIPTGPAERHAGGMAPARSAGLVLYRIDDGRPVVLLAHMGGPLWARKDDGAWSIPKGEYADDEDPLAAARREFTEELGLPVPDGAVTALTVVKQAGGKLISAFAVEGEVDVTAAVSNTFELEWPKGSGTMRTFPEIDRVAWFTIDAARVKLLKGQLPLLDELVARLATR